MYLTDYEITVVYIICEQSPHQQLWWGVNVDPSKNQTRNIHQIPLVKTQLRYTVICLDEDKGTKTGFFRRMLTRISCGLPMNP